LIEWGNILVHKLKGVFVLSIPFDRDIDDFFVTISELLKEDIMMDVKQIIILCHQYFDCAMPPAKDVIDTIGYRELLSKIMEKHNCEEIITISGHYHNHFEELSNKRLPIYGVGTLIDNSYKDEGCSKGAMVLRFDEESEKYKPEMVSFARTFAKELGKFVTYSFDDYVHKGINFDKDFVRINVPLSESNSDKLLGLKNKERVLIKYLKSEQTGTTQDVNKTSLPKPENILKRVVDKNSNGFDKVNLLKVGLDILSEVNPSVS
jgi:hypothetical protein